MSHAIIERIEMSSLAVWLFGKLFLASRFLLYRVASWTGTLYLYKRGRRSGARAYYVLSAVVYAASWAMFFTLFTRVGLLDRLHHVILALRPLEHRHAWN